MACCDEPKLLPVVTAIDRMLEAVNPPADFEQLALNQLLDRILAEDIHAQLNVPGHDNSAMDGYALRAQDADKPLHLAGQSLAGHAFQGSLEPGQCVRITTGAVIPTGADAVVMQENTRIDGQHINVTQTPRPGENIRRAGEDIAQGDRVLSKGHRLSPVDVALLASLGVAEAEVYRRLKVAVLSTGDELTAPGQPLTAGQIYDSNRYGIVALLQRLNVEVIDLGLIPDREDAIRATLQNASQRADAVISSGGVSVGEADFVKDILDELGEINFWKVAIKPGKPFAFGSLGRACFFGLPGNPVSAMVTLHQLALPVLRAMAGEVTEQPITLNATAASRYKKRPGRQDFQRATLRVQEGENIVSSTGPQGSGVLTSFAGANCYVVLEQERGTVEEGETVQVVPFDRFIL
ncbi:gephyrin-like molybdotransferase Glp [Marinimicrobium sp. ABcell2]|uniref:molybdopterin molybdotransferase MoeA n=1 Tax=Marinimicrobium sp. ABcell2 TaxID=3069751 RepID=UPI0027AF89A9|nr:gephyrin-like molybdotransferase Glp [Marinimicrobium sp. ABcell2]MDQ2076418.1 molybdopterin molybdotransferase MoeA [Marinimicrobium sp. ABcell2]